MTCVRPFPWLRAAALVLLAACSSDPPTAGPKLAQQPARPVDALPPTEPSPAPAPPLAPPEVEAARASNAFGFSLYALARSAQENVIISPTSLTLAFAMVQEGARGATADELARLLRLQKLADPPAALAALRAALGKINGRDGLELTVASRLWGQKGYAFNPDYLATLRDRHAAQLGEVDFKAAPADACKQINAWTEKATKQRIKGSCTPDALPPELRLVLGNAVYFRGKWASKFDAALTKDADFHVANDTTVKVPMMQRRGAFRMATLTGLRLLELPYQGGLRMIVLLPDKVDDVRTVEEQLAPSFEKWLAKLEDNPEVKVSLPRFRATGTLSLPGLLEAMGVRTLFNAAAADLSGIGAEKPLSLGSAIHQGFIQVDEQGTEAAAVTTVGFEGAAASQPVEFTADHPFVYVIQEPTTGAILFLGRVVDPTK